MAEHNLTEEIRRRFLEQYLVDQDGDTVRSLAEYQRLFAGHEEIVAAAFDELTGEAAADAPAEQRRIDRYRILEKLGSGGQGTVYLAEDTAVRRRVALKILPGLGERWRETLSRFKREAEVAANIEHPGICPVYDAGEANGVPFIAMRYVPGKSLAARIQAASSRNAEDPSTPSFVAMSDDPTPSTSATAELMQTVQFIEKAARALHAAHEAGVVHRDLKPGNIMVEPQGDPVVLDFGLARVEEGGETITRTGDAHGTPEYMPPEQIRGERVDRRADVYALGVTLYECLTLDRPYRRATKDAVYRAVLVEQAADPRTLNARISRDLAVVLETAMAKEPDRRYRTAEALAEDLRRVREHEPILARPAGPLLRLKRWARRRPAAAALVGVLVIGGPALSAFGTHYLFNVVPSLEREATTRRKQALERSIARGLLALYAQDDAPRAVRIFQQAAEAHPESAEARIMLVVGLLTADRDAEANAQLDEARDSGNPELVRMRRFFLEHRASGPKGQPTPALATEIEHVIAGIRAMGQKRYRRAYEHFHWAMTFAKEPRLIHGILMTINLGNLADRAELDHLDRLMRAHWPASPEVWHFLGNAWHDIDGDRAIAAFEKSLEYEDDSEVRVNLGMLLHKRGRLDEALVHVKRALEIEPDLFHAQYNLGVIYRKQGRYAEAATALEKTLRRHPDEIDPYLDINGVYAKLGRLDQAEAISRIAVERFPDDGRTHVNLGVSLTAQHRVEEALAPLRRGAQLLPRKAQARCAYGGALLGAGRLDEAAVELNAAVVLDPAFQPARTLLESLKKLRSPALSVPAAPAKAGTTSIADLRKTIEREPDHADHHARLADALLRNGKPREAVTPARRAIELDKRHVEARRILAQAYHELGRTERAVEQLQEAVAVDLRSGDAWFDLGNRLDDLNKLDEAAEAYRAGIRVMPDNWKLHYNLGTTLMRAGRYEAATDALRDAAAQGARSPSVYTNLGIALRRLKRPAEAVVALKKAIEIAPNHLSAYQTLGNAYKDLGRREEEIAILRRAVAVDPNAVEIWFNLANGLDDIGEYQQSIAGYRKALELAPDDPSTHANLGLMLRKVGKLKEGLALLERCRSLPDPDSRLERWIARHRELMALSLRLDDIEAKRATPVDIDDSVKLAQAAYDTGRYRLSTALYTQAIERDPGLVDSPSKPHRYNAASSAALVAAGYDRSVTDDAVRAAHRQKALDWLFADLAASRAGVTAGTYDQEAAVKDFEFWKKDRDFRTLREKRFVDRLPAGIQAQCRRLWRAVDELLATARE